MVKVLERERSVPVVPSFQATIFNEIKKVEINSLRSYDVKMGYTEVFVGGSSLEDKIEICLLEGVPFLIGRQSVESPFTSSLLSRKHAELLALSDKIYLRDIGSSNGTFLNGRRLSKQGESSPFTLVYTLDCPCAMIQFGEVPTEVAPDPILSITIIKVTPKEPESNFTTSVSFPSENYECSKYVRLHIEKENSICNEKPLESPLFDLNGISLPASLGVKKFTSTRCRTISAITKGQDQSLQRGIPTKKGFFLGYMLYSGAFFFFTLVTLFFVFRFL